MLTISSAENRIFKTVKSLEQKKYRDELGLYIIEGPKPIKEAMDQNIGLRFIFTKVGSQAGDEFARLYSPNGCGPALYQLAGNVFSKLEQTENGQGIIAVAEKKEPDPEAFFEKNKNYLLLDRIQDPGNLGTLIRSAEAMGFSGAVLVKGSCDLYSPKLVRSAAGSLFRLKCISGIETYAAIALAKKACKTIFAASADAKLSISEAKLSRDVIIAVGNEGRGISEELLKASVAVSIPMEGKTESLNASVAGSVIMYESLRQKMSCK